MLARIHDFVSRDFKKRFEEKLIYAKVNGGQLLITPHNPRMDMSGGVIPNYIHCLPYIVGAIPFSDGQESTIIKIKLSSKAKVWKYRGPQSQVDFTKVEPDVDLIHTVYDNETFFQWQEMLLARNDNIETWTADPEEIKNDFFEQLQLLKKRQLTQEHFFYRDFTLEEQYDIAILVGHHVGLDLRPQEVVEDLKKRFNEVYKRIEKKYGLAE